MKTQIEIDIPDNSEFVRFGVPKVGEDYLGRHGEALKATGQEYWPAIIVRPAWQWPAWLKAEWIAMDANGCWCAYDKECEMSASGSYWSTDGKFTELDRWWLDFSGPPCHDWRQSKRRRPT